MFSFLKKPGEYPSESKWSILQGQNNGKPMIVRRNTSAKQLSSNPEFAYRVGFAIPLLAPNEVGLPTNEETASLNQIEDELSVQLEKDKASILVLSITTGGMREFVFYTKDSQMVEKVVIDVRSKFSSHEIQYYVEEDKKWSVYKQFA
ncbi:MAG: DUF695 domain-containing protein [Chloroflexi bacterium]|nr:DUF695 domain-containing protein [Chloroflexota bacterium]